MSKLRGKKLRIMKPTKEYAKVPRSVLKHPELTPIDKLIIAYLYGHSDSGNYILAYTRLAKELHIDKSNLIKRWKWLIKNGYIKEDNENYYVMFGISPSNDGSLNPPVDIGSLNPPSDNNRLDKTTKDGSINPPTDGSLNPPTKVGSPLLNGSPTPPNENNKEENKELNTKTEHGFSSGNSFKDKPTSNLNLKENQIPQLDRTTKITFDEYLEIHPLTELQSHNMTMHELYRNKYEDNTIEYNKIYTTQFEFNRLLNLNHKLTFDEAEMIRRTLYYNASSSNSIQHNDTNPSPTEEKAKKETNHHNEVNSKSEDLVLKTRRIEEEINRYESSDYFENDNLNFVSSLYLKFHKHENFKYKISLEKFENCLFFIISTNYSSSTSREKFSNQEINDWIKNEKPHYDVGIFNSLFNSLNKESVKDKYELVMSQCRKGLD